jgi:hypothetical protein
MTMEGKVAEGNLTVKQVAEELGISPHALRHRIRKRLPRPDKRRKYELTRDDVEAVRERLTPGPKKRKG